MSERINSIAENTQPSRDEVLAAFDDKRRGLDHQREQLNTENDARNSKYGGLLNAEEILARNQANKAYANELAQNDADHESFNDEYRTLGGEQLDAAQTAYEALNFKSTAEDRVAAQARLRDAKNAFYENYLSAQNIDIDQAAVDANRMADQIRADRNAGKDTVKQEVGKSKDVDSTSEPSKADQHDPRFSMTGFPEGTTTEVDGDKLIITVPKRDVASVEPAEPVEPAAQEKIDDETASQPSSQEDAPERSQKYKMAAKFRETLKSLSSNPLAFLSSRLYVHRAMRANERAAKNDAAELSGEKRKTWTTKRILGATAITLVATAFIAKDGFDIFGHGSTDALAATPDFTNPHGVDHVASTLLPDAPPHTTDAAGVHDALGATSHAPTPEVNAGSGWEDVLRDMGIRQEDWKQTMDEAGPKLQRDGLAYWDKGAHEWRINPKDNFTLSQSTADYLKSVATAKND